MITDVELWQVDKGRQARLDAGLKERGEMTVSERIGWLVGAGVLRIPTVEVVIEVVDKDDNGNPIDPPKLMLIPEQLYEGTPTLNGIVFVAPIDRLPKVNLPPKVKS